MSTAILLLGAIATCLFVAVLRSTARGDRTSALVPAISADEPQNPRPERYAMPRLRILVVDSNPLIGRTVRRLLVAHEVTMVTSADDALSALSRDDGFDVILYAFMMPRLSGADFASALAERHPELRPRLVFLISETTMPETRAAFARSEVRWVSKPIGYVQLATCVSDAAAQRT